MTKKTPLLGKTLGELKAIVQDLGMPKFTAGQIASWLYEKKVGSIEEMTNLSLKNRERLMENYEVGASAPVHEMRSVDGTVKYLFCTPEGDYIESVYIPDDDRATLCVSSQVGCKMNCLFCQTGKQQILYDRKAGIHDQPDSCPDSESDLFCAGTGYADQRGVYGHGRTVRQPGRSAACLGNPDCRLWLQMEPEAYHGFNHRCDERLETLFRGERMSSGRKSALALSYGTSFLDAG